MAYRNHINNQNTSVHGPQFGKNQVKNSTGGYVFQLDKFAQLERFLILGCEGGTYYSGEGKLTRENAQIVYDCIAEDAERTVRTIVEISDQGRAIKNDPAVFALAICASSKNDTAVRAAFDNLNKVCRIGTHLFQFVATCNDLRGWGRGLRDAVSNWYLQKRPDQLARQVTKYAQREGWSHRDVLRLAHTAPISDAHQEIFQYVCQNGTWADGEEYGNPLLEAVHEAKTADEKRIVQLINEAGLEREHIPTEFLNSTKVWEALLPNLRQTALIRNLGKLSSIGIIKPLSKHSQTIADRIADAEALKKGRVHPFSILLALQTYKAGRGFRGSLEWTVDPKIKGALEDAFYMAFDAVEPCGKNFMFALDVSESMGWGNINNTNVSCRLAAACLSLVSTRTEPNTYSVGFSNGVVDLGLTPKMRLEDVDRVLNGFGWNFSATNPGAAVQFAIDNGLEVDSFVVITDNECNRGKQPSALLEQYRQRFGRETKMIVVGMTSTGFSMADPSDPRQLDIVGFDSTGPQVISEFSR